MVLAAIALFGIRGTAAAEPRPAAAVVAVHIKNNNGLCMDIGSNAPGTLVGITDCFDGYTSQWWYRA
jgi:hypothetical protein